MAYRTFIKGLHLRDKLTKEPLKKNPLNTVGWFCIALLGKVCTTLITARVDKEFTGRRDAVIKQVLTALYWS